MMGFDASLSGQDTITEASFSSQQSNYNHSSQHQHQYLNSSPCIKHEPVTFVQHLHLHQQQQQQQQQQLYQGHQEHKGFVQNSTCDCYQNGSNQGCPRCQTNEEHNNSGTFIYQTIQADESVRAHQPNECSSRTQTNNTLIHHNNQSTGYSSSSSSSPTSLIANQQASYEDSIKYYVKQEESLNQSGSYSNATTCAQISDLISDSCQTTACNFDNGNNRNEDDVVIKHETDIGHGGGSSGMFYQCPTSNNELVHPVECNRIANDDWEVRSLVEVPSAANQDELFACKPDSNNNARQFSTQYSSVIQSHPQESSKSYQLGYQQQFNNNDDFSTIQLYENNYQVASGQGEQVSFGNSYESITTTIQHISHLGVAVNYNQLAVDQQQQSGQLQLESDSPFVHDLESPACVSSAGGEVSSSSRQYPQLQATLGQPTVVRSKSSRKDPASLSKVNGKLWEFIRDLLLSDRTNPAFIRWERREDGVFKFVQSNKVAKMWGERKQNPKMTYEKLSRAMRYYYKSKVLLPVFGRRLVYKFGPNASGWNKTG